MKSNFLLRVPLKEQILFTRNLAIMQQSGMPLLEGLHLMQKQTQNRSMRKILASVVIDVENGQFLSTAFKRYESVFGSLFVNIIEIGESGGVLAENLKFLSDELKKKLDFRGKIMGAMMYPSIIILTTFGLVGILTFVVFPKILPIFDSFNVKLPLTTRIVISSNKFLLHEWAWLLLGLIIIVTTFVSLLRLPRFRFGVQKLMLHVPVIGPMLKATQMTMIARTLALLMRSGVKIVEAIQSTSDVSNNLVYKQSLVKAGEQVKSGQPLGKFFGLQPKLYPIVFCQMVEMSEAAGTLDSTLAYLGEYYENELDDTTKTMVALLEPLLMLFMGGLVGFMAISIILPIYSISQIVSQ